ncbi:MAG TPA: acyl-CoA thioesterase [Solirubrobacteraceae bacterium]|nr:acyl-CoA thioesterase [Solirubrobacteraceae bacterium]
MHAHSARDSHSASDSHSAPDSRNAPDSPSASAAPDARAGAGSHASPPPRARPAVDSHATLAHWMGPLDANGAGSVHGGTVMKLCDEAAGLAAVKHCRQRVVTASVDRMNFMVPIHVGELVTFQASVNAAWRTSMEVGVRVDTENPRTGERRHSNSAYLTMVAVGDDGHPTAVPPLLVQSDDERRRESEAQLRRRNRLAERQQILAGR